MPKLNSLEVVHQDTNKDSYETLHDIIVGLKGSQNREVVDGEARAAYEALLEMYVNDKEAFARRIETLEAEFGDSLAQVVEEMLAYASASEAYAKKITTVSAEVANANAMVQTEMYARATEDEALASQITTVTARLDTGDFATVKEYAEASVTKASTYKQTTAPTSDSLVEGDIWMDTDDNNKLYRYDKIPVSRTVSSVNTSTDIITVSVSTGYSVGEKLVFSVTSGATPIGGLTSGSTYYAIPITSNTFKVALTVEDAIANTAIDLTSSGSGTRTFTRDTFSWVATDDVRISDSVDKITNIEARWGVTTNVNGQVAGIQLLNGTNTQSSFTVDATKFIVKKPDGSNGIVWNGSNSRLDISGNVYANAFYGNVISTNNVNSGAVGNISAVSSASNSTYTVLNVSGVSGETYILYILAQWPQVYYATTTIYLDGSPLRTATPLAGNEGSLMVTTTVSPGSYTIQVNNSDSRNDYMALYTQVIKR